jgi:hypothetical protein
LPIVPLAISSMRLRLLRAASRRLSSISILGFVIALFLKETAPRKTGAV